MATVTTTTIDKERLNELRDRRDRRHREGGAGRDWRSPRALPGPGGERTLKAPQAARRTGTTELYVREWLAAQAAFGYLDYDPDIERYGITPEQAAMFADDSSPGSWPGRSRWHSAP